MRGRPPFLGVGAPGQRLMRTPATTGRHPPTQAAVASVTGRDVREVGKLSVQQLAFCCGVPPDRGCRNGWTIEAALQQLVKCAPLLLDRCLPYKPDFRSDAAVDELCSANRVCQDTSPVASKGTYRYRALTSVWEAQARGGGWGGAGHGGWRASGSVAGRRRHGNCAAAEVGGGSCSWSQAAGLVAYLHGSTSLAFSPTTLLLPLHPSPLLLPRPLPPTAPHPAVRRSGHQARPQNAVTGCLRGSRLLNCQHACSAAARLPPRRLRRFASQLGLRARTLRACTHPTHTGACKPFNAHHLERTRPRGRRRLDVYDDLRSYFQDYSHSYNIYSPRPGAKLVEAHALLLVGYDNAGRYWVARWAARPS
jgi:hypothetical protein